MRAQIFPEYFFPVCVKIVDVFAARCSVRVRSQKKEKGDKMQSVIDLVTKLKGSKDFGDWCDRLNHQYMVYLLAILVIVGASQQYVSDPIQCWCPETFTYSAVAYTKSYCWTANTYSITNRSANASSSTIRDAEINYYQWVPHMLCGMAFMFKLPFLIWLFLGEKSGISLEKINGFVSDFVFEGHEDKYQTNLQLIAKVLDRWLKQKNKPHHKKALICDRLYTKIKRNFLTVSYVAVKILFCTNCVLQFVILDVFLRMQFGAFGYELLFEAGYMFRQHESVRLPHVTWCDIEISSPDYNHTHRVQCVLPINILNEKIFGIVWICLIVLSVCSFINCFAWIYLLCFKNRLDYVQKLYETEENLDLDKMKLFTYTYLGSDGCFLLRIIDGNSVDIDMSDLVEIFWNMFFSPKKKPTNVDEPVEARALSDIKMTMLGPVKTAETGQL